MTAINSNRAIRGPVTAVPVVAGKGVRLVADTENNRWVVEADETVLYTNSGVPSSNTDQEFTLSEPVTNFERIRVELWNREFNQYRTTFEFVITDSSTATQFIASMDHSTGTGNQQRVNMMIGYNSSGNLVDKGHGLFFANGGSYTNASNRGLGIHRVVGVNRIASN